MFNFDWESLERLYSLRVCTTISLEGLLTYCKHSPHTESWASWVLKVKPPGQAQDAPTMILWLYETENIYYVVYLVDFLGKENIIQTTPVNNIKQFSPTIFLTHHLLRSRDIEVTNVLFQIQPLSTSWGCLPHVAAREGDVKVKSGKSSDGGDGLETLKPCVSCSISWFCFNNAFSMPCTCLHLHWTLKKSSDSKIHLKSTHQAKM